MTVLSDYQSRAKRRKLAVYILRYVIILIALVFFVFPIFWITMMAFKSPSEYFNNPPVWFPSELYLEHFRQLDNTRALKALGDSVLITVSSTLLALIVGIPAAYSLARFNTGGHNFSFWILSQRFLPPVAIVFPIFLLFRTIKLVDTYQGLIILYSTFNLPFVVWMMRTYFKDVPVEIEESAQIDGCSRPRVLWSITLPLATPGLIATAVFTFVFTWNEFLFALVLTRTKVITLPVVMSSYFGVQSAYWGEAAALSLIATVPILVVTLLVQRHLVTGLTLGAVK